jgi:hypothetical protein
MKVAHSYIYRYIYFPYISNNSYIPFEKYLEENQFTKSIIFKIGSHFLDAFVKLSLIEYEYVDDEQTNNLCIIVKEKLLEIFEDANYTSSFNLPMIQ